MQLLFADAATGARSTSMVSQGRVGAIIAAKPEQRRTLLEEAAGITGLHSRRHEAELRLNATENNLERVKDVLKAQDEQLTILKKQSKQAERYKYIQKDITKARARLFYKKWIDEKDKLKNANEKIQSETNVVNDQTQVVAQINVEFEKVQETLPNLDQHGNCNMLVDLGNYRVQPHDYIKSQPSYLQREIPLGTADLHAIHDNPTHRDDNVWIKCPEENV